MTTESPILFSAPMVRALLAGSKTKTRRIVKPQPPAECDIHYMLGNETWRPAAERSPLRHAWEAWGGPLFESRPKGNLCGSHEVRCPYGKPGDTIWVRETWRPGAWREDGRVAIDYRASPEANRTPWLNVPPDKWEDLYLKLGDEALDALAAGRGSVRRTPDGDFAWDRGDSPCKWRPSIFMPRWASRITLRIKSVRVERLQDISDEDALAEGINRIAHGREGYYYHGTRTEPHPHNWCYPADAFRDLWDGWNKKRGVGWDTNPLVWVISFERVEPPQIISKIIPEAADDDALNAMKALQ